MKTISTLVLIVSLFLSICSSYGKTKHNDTSSQIKDSVVLSTGWYYVADTSNVLQRILDRSTDTFSISPKPIVLAKDFAMVEINEIKEGGQKVTVLTMLLNEEGTEIWSRATEKAIDKELAFVLDNKLICVVKITAQITVGVATLNRSIYSRQELEKFQEIIGSER
jgi:preprotein translocase subunit SecD